MPFCRKVKLLSAPELYAKVIPGITSSGSGFRRVNVSSSRTMRASVSATFSKAVLTLMNSWQNIFAANIIARDVTYLSNFGKEASHNMISSLQALMKHFSVLHRHPCICCCLCINVILLMFCCFVAFIILICLARLLCLLLFCWLLLLRTYTRSGCCRSLQSTSTRSAVA